MKRPLLILLMAFAGAVAAYAIYFRLATAPAQAMMSRAGGELEWLCHEFHLDDAQVDAVRALHEEYEPKCMLMCQKIAQANAKADKLIGANSSVTPEIEAALKECVVVQQECRQAMLGHVYAVAAQMSPEQRARYLAMMKGRIIEPGLSHRAVISESAK